MYNANISNVAQTVVELPALIDNLLLLLSDKEKNVIKKRFSLSGTPKSTLEEIGKDFSVTRERVRQIERSALMKMRRNVFNTALRHIHDFSSEVVKQNGGFLKEFSFLENLKSVLPSGIKIENNSIHLSLVLNDKLDCVGNTIDFHPYLRDKSLSDYTLKFVSGQLINQLNKYGNVKSIEKLCIDLKNNLKDVEFDVVKMKSLVGIDKRLTILDNELVGLLEWRHINPRTLRDKILYILRSDKKPMHFLDISKKIEGIKFDNRTINVQAVHNELIRHDNFVLIGRGIYALSEWGYESGTVTNVIGKLLQEKGELSQDEIVNQVLKQRQVKKITILLALKNSEKFERVGRKMYKLVKN